MNSTILVGLRIFEFTFETLKGLASRSFHKPFY